MKNKWIKPRHKVARVVCNAVLKPIVKIKYNVKIEKYKLGKKPCLILYNHQTAFDQFFVDLAFNKKIYHVASDDLFSNGFISWLLKTFVAPIPIKKQVSDIVAVKNCIKVAKEGGTICIAPEGSRTYSGKTEYFNPAIVGLVKMLKLPVLIFKIEGGYGVHPRWSNVMRKGKMKAGVSRTILPEEYLNLDKNELYNLLKSELYVNEANSNNVYKSNKKAEYLERVLYVCPKCGLSTFESKNDVITCKNCGLEIEYLENTELSFKNSNYNFKHFNDLYEYQQNFVNGLDLLNANGALFYQDVAKIYNVKRQKRKILIQNNAKTLLYSNKIEVVLKNKTLVFNFENIEGISVVGRNKLNVYYDKNVYQLKGDYRFNAVKYLNFYYRYANQLKENENGFLGL